MLFFLLCAMFAIASITATIPVITPPKAVLKPLPPIVAPIGDYDFGSSPPLPQLPDKTYSVHHDPNVFPDVIFDRPKDEHKTRPLAKDIQPRPAGRWLHTMVELDDIILMYGGVINAKTMLNDMWSYSPSKQLWNQKQRPTLPMPVLPPGDKYKDKENANRPTFAPEPPEMRALPAENNGAKTQMEMDPDGGNAPPDEMDPDVSLPIYHTPWIPVINPDMPTTEDANAAADGSPVTTDAASTSGGLMGGRRRRLLAELHTQTLSKILPTTSALLRGRREQDPSPIVTIHDFWEFNMESSSWLRIPPNEGTNNPLRRSLHTSIAIGEKMFVFGGVGVDNNVLMNDIWSYDIKTRQWEELDVGDATNRPLPREGHVMVKGPFEETTSFTIHGGMGYGYVPYEDTWTFELATKTWSQIAVVKNIEKEWVPPGRWMHSAVTINKEMFVFGGCSKDYAAMEDLWKLKLGKKKAQWTRIEPIGFPPPGRWLHTADVIQSDVGTRGSFAMIIYAGATSSSPLQDMWVFRPDDESWVEIEAVLDTPFAREGHASVMLKPKAATLRRRRLLMDGPGDVDIASGALSDMPDVAINGPDEMATEKEKLDEGPEVKDSASTSQLMFVFGGSSEPGLVSEIQDPSPL